MAITYLEYEFLSRKINEMCIGIEIMLNKTDGDIEAITGFTVPDISAENITDSLEDMRNTGKGQVKELRRLNEKLKTCIE